MDCDNKFKERNCVSNGKYCSMGAASGKDVPSKFGITGREQVLEDLREMCIFTIYKEQFDFMGTMMFFEYIQK